MWALFLLLLCLPLQAYAFPDNSVLDTITGTDTTTPLNANWTSHELRNGSAGLNIRSNAAAPGGTGGYWGGYWNVGTFGPAAEAYITIVNIGSTGFGGICVRLSVPGGDNTADGYCIEWADGTSALQLLRLDNASVTNLGSAITQTITTTDKVGITAEGDQICAWFSDSGGAWTNLGCQTDSTYTASGYIGMYLNGTTTVGAHDDFGGGTMAAAAASFITRRRLP